MRRFLASYVREVEAAANGIDAAGEASLADKLGLVRQLEQALADAGYDDLVAQYQQTFTSIGRESLDYFKFIGEDFTFSGIDVETIDTMVDQFTEDFALQVDSRIRRRMESRVRQTVFGLRERRDIATEVRRIVDDEVVLRKDGKQFTDANVEVLVADSHKQFYRQVRAEKARALGLNVLVYVGPLDNKTRPACRAMLTDSRHGISGFFEESEVNINLVPGLTANPRTAGGGWNCRHDFYEVTREYAESRGYIS